MNIQQQTFNSPDDNYHIDRIFFETAVRRIRLMGADAKHPCPLAARWQHMADMIDRAKVGNERKNDVGRIASDLRLIAASLEEQPGETSISIDKTLFLDLFSNFKFFTNVMDYYREMTYMDKPIKDGNIIYMVPQDKIIRPGKSLRFFFNEERDKLPLEKSGDFASDNVSITGKFSSTILNFFSESPWLLDDYTALVESRRNAPATTSLPDFELA